VVETTMEITGWLRKQLESASPDLLRAMVQDFAEALMAGVSTRRVEMLVQQLGVERVSKSQVSRLAKSLDAIVEDFRTRPLEEAPYPYLVLDALEVKCRESGRTVNACVVHAIAVNRDGFRESLGLDVVTQEDGAAWSSGRDRYVNQTK
jgi:putative transposase